LRILLDHCVPKRAARLFPGYDVQTCRQAKFDSLENGALLVAASEVFDLLVTTDKNIRFQHDLQILPLSILELNTLFTRFVDLQALLPWMDLAMSASEEYRFVTLGSGGVIERFARR